MKKVILILFTLAISFNAFSQVTQSQRNMNRIPQTNSAPTDQEIEKQKRQMEERKNEFIETFLSTLEADDFQKEIIKQSLNSYFDERIAIMKTPFERTFDREQALKKLEETHFLDLKDLISKEDMEKIHGMIKGEYDEKEVKSKKKKKKKKKKKQKKDKG